MSTQSKCFVYNTLRHFPLSTSVKQGRQLVSPSASCILHNPVFFSSFLPIYTCVFSFSPNPQHVLSSYMFTSTNTNRSEDKKRSINHFLDELHTICPLMSRPHLLYRSSSISKVTSDQLLHILSCCVRCSMIGLGVT